MIVQSFLTIKTRTNNLNVYFERIFSFNSSTWKFLHLLWAKKKKSLYWRQSSYQHSALLQLNYRPISFSTHVQRIKYRQSSRFESVRWLYYDSWTPYKSGQIERVFQSSYSYSWSTSSLSVSSEEKKKISLAMLLAKKKNSKFDAQSFFFFLWINRNTKSL